MSGQLPCGIRLTLPHHIVKGVGSKKDLLELVAVDMKHIHGVQASSVEKICLQDKRGRAVKERASSRRGNEMEGRSWKEGGREREKGAGKGAESKA